MNPTCVCGANRYRTLWGGIYRRTSTQPYALSVIRCLVCGLARTAPTPNLGYDPAQSCVAGASTWASTIATQVLDATKGRGPVLDVGCHTGDVVSALRDLGVESEGV